VSNKKDVFIPANLPYLPFQNKTFDLGLYSPLLFLYSTPSYSFHIKARSEIPRVAGKVRVYLVADMNCIIPSIRDHLVKPLKDEEYICEQRLSDAQDIQSREYVERGEPV